MIKSETPEAEEKLNAREFSQARKDVWFQRSTPEQWAKADARQRDILHNIDLLRNSLTEEEMEDVKEELETDTPDQKIWY